MKFGCLFGGFMLMFAFVVIAISIALGFMVAFSRFMMMFVFVVIAILAVWFTIGFAGCKACKAVHNNGLKTVIGIVWNGPTNTVSK